MQFKASSATLAALVGTVSAHTRIFGAWVNDVDQGDGRTTYVRSPPNNNPVKDLTSPDLFCNAAGATAMPEFVSAAAGDTVALEWVSYHIISLLISHTHGALLSWSNIFDSTTTLVEMTLLRRLTRVLF